MLAAVTAEYQAAIEACPDILVHEIRGRRIAAPERGRGGLRLSATALALRIQPDDVGVLNMAAWLLATSPEVSMAQWLPMPWRCGCAEKLTSGADPAVADTLAAAYAESCMFNDAAETCARAVALAQGQRNAALAEKIAARLKLYETGAPYRDNR